MYIENRIKPYLVSGGYPKENAWHFFTPKGEIKIEGCNDMLFKLFPFCDGYTPVSEIVEQFTDSWDEFFQLLEALFDNQILVDANKIYEVFYAYSRNPMPFYQSMTFEETCAFSCDDSHLPLVTGKTFKAQFQKERIQEVMDVRCSTRHFRNESVSGEKIFSILWCAYGVQTKRIGGESEFLERTYTVPSGGALYPLTIYLILLKDCLPLNVGIYCWHKEKSLLEIISAGDFSEDVKGIIDGINAIEKATGIICIVANFERSAKKYGNKAYNLIQQEVGHVMQNVALFCAENELGVVEIGGYNDETLSQLLSIDFPRKAPLIVAAFGKREIYNGNDSI